MLMAAKLLTSMELTVACFLSLQPPAPIGSGPARRGKYYDLVYPVHEFGRELSPNRRGLNTTTLSMRFMNSGAKIWAREKSPSDCLGVNSGKHLQIRGLRREAEFSACRRGTG